MYSYSSYSVSAVAQVTWYPSKRDMHFWSRLRPGLNAFQPDPRKTSRGLMCDVSGEPDELYTEGA